MAREYLAPEGEDMVEYEMAEALCELYLIPPLTGLDGVRSYAVQVSTHLILLIQFSLAFPVPPAYPIPFALGFPLAFPHILFHISLILIPHLHLYPRIRAIV